MFIFTFAVIINLSVGVLVSQPASNPDPLPPAAVARMGSTHFTHFHPISWVGFAPDGKAVLTSAGEIRFWDMTTQKELDRIQSWASSARDTFAVSADGSKMALWDFENETLRILNVVSRKEIRRLAGEELFGPKEKRPHHRFILSPDGRFLAIGIMHVAHLGKRETFPGFLDVWDLGSGRRIHTWKTGDIFHVEFAPDSKSLLAHEWDDGRIKSIVRSWDVHSGMERGRVELPRRLSRFLVSGDGKSILGLSQDRKALHRYEIATGQELEAVMDEGGPIFAFALSPDGQNLATARPGRALVQRLRDGKKVLEVSYPRTSLVDEHWTFTNAELVAFSSDSKTIAIAKGRKLDLWDLATGTKTNTEESMGGPVVAVHTYGHHLLARGLDEELSLWDLRTGKFQRRFHAEPGDRSSRQEWLRNSFNHFHWRGNDQAISPDGSKVAAVWRDGPIHLFDLASGKLLRCFKGSDFATCLAFSPTGKLLAGPLADGQICLWDTMTGKQIQRLTPPPLADASPNGPPIFLALRFSLDGRALAASTWIHHEARDFLHWELATGDLRTPIKGEKRSTQVGGNLTDKSTLSIVAAPDGKHLAVAGPRSIRLLDLGTGKETCRFGGRDVVGQSAAFSPDGKLFAAGLENGGIRFWDMMTGRVICDAAHQMTVTSLAFADPRTLVSGSLDGTAITWDVARLLKTAASSSNKLEPLWETLSLADAEKGAVAMQAFAARSNEAVEFFQKRIQPAPLVDSADIEKLIVGLQSNQFTVRQSANLELELLDGQARSALEKALDGAPVEARRRIEMLLQKLTPPIAAPEILRGIRAIEVLERIGTTEARTLLGAIAGGAPAHRLTEEAREAVQRMKSHP